MISEKACELISELITESVCIGRIGERAHLKKLDKLSDDLEDYIATLERQLAELRWGVDPKERKPEYGMVVHAHIGNGYYDRVFRNDDFPHLDEWHSDTKPCVTYATIDRWWHLPEVGE